MKKMILFSLCLCLLSGTLHSQKINTYCNPVNLNYRFQPDNKIPYREAADPTIRLYNNKYILFVSHSGGYWYSDDLLKWKFLPIKTLPIGDYAPDAITINDTTFFIASSSERKPIYYTTDPFTDNWKVYGSNLPFPVWDPHFFVDNDGRRYLYWGCSNSDNQPIRVIELDKAMRPMNAPFVAIKHNPSLYGWEIPGETNEPEKNGYNEGAWLTKYNNRYYLQYASPGTEFKTYADGVYTSTSPTGPFTYETYSPFSYKPGGFAGGAGHSSTFSDKYGNFWHIATLSISVRHMFERRLALFPAAFDIDGVLRTFTAFGDYPTVMPQRKIDFSKETLFSGWMLLSYNKKVTVSSEEENHKAKDGCDENIRTWWSAATGNAGEYIIVDLGQKMNVNSVQVNFADNESQKKPQDRDNYYCYKIFASDNQENWKLICDKSNNTVDACHDYIELSKPLAARFIKLENVKVPDGKFSVYDLRIFGSAKGNAPGEVTGFDVKRNPSDSRRASVKWDHKSNATGFVVNYGTEPTKLYTSVMVYSSDSLMLTGLNKGVKYYFSIDSFNESGISHGKKVITAE